MVNKAHDIFTEIGERDPRLLPLLFQLLWRPKVGMKLVFFGQDLTHSELKLCLGLRLRRE